MTATASIAETATKLLDINAVAALLSCSNRHIYRLADSGRMPAPYKLGNLCRWSRDEIEKWISGGCKPVRTVTSN